MRRQIVTILLGTISVCSSNAVTVLDRVSSTSVYGGWGTFTTTAEAFAAAVEHTNSCTPDGACKVLSDFHYCPPGHSQVSETNWGVPNLGCGVLRYYDRYGKLIDVIQDHDAFYTTALCPRGYSIPLSDVPGPNLEYRCDRTTNYPDPRTCDGVGNPISAGSGVKTQKEVDFVDPAGTLDVSRTYSSLLGRFQFGYFEEFITPRLADSRMGTSSSCRRLGVSYDFDNIRGKIGCFERLSEYNTLSYGAPNGDRFNFDWLGGVATPREPFNKYRVVYIDGAEPKWVLTKPDQKRQLVFDPRGRLKQIVQASGISSTNIYSGSEGPLQDVVDSFGRAIHFTYNPDTGELTSITEVGGEIISYETANEFLDAGKAAGLAALNTVITAVHFPGGTSKLYHWNETDHVTNPRYSNALTGITDEENNRFGDYLYANDMAIETSHAGGKERYAIVDNRTNGVGQVSITDPLGTARVSTYELVASSSVPTGWSQPGGSGCNQSTKAVAFDSAGNPKLTSDFVGGIVCTSFDSTRNVELYRIEGLPATKSAVCDKDLATYQIPDGLADDKAQRKVSTKWHPLWNLEVQKAEPKLITTTVYNGQPDPITHESSVICAPDAPLLPDGVNTIAVVCRRYEQSTADLTGSVGFSAPETGRRVWNYQYNQFGQMTNEIDPRGKPTAHAYWPTTSFPDGLTGHTTGDLMTVTNALGQQTQYLSYNKRGQPLSVIYPNGSKEFRTYHVRGWLDTVALRPSDAVDSSRDQITKYDYYDTGLLKQVTQPDGSWTYYKWDPAHRLYEVSDSSNNKVTYTLDDAGNRTKEEYQDPQGPNGQLAKTITRVFDVLGRMSSTTGAN